MKVMYDLYNKLQANSVTGIEYNAFADSVEYNSIVCSVKASNQNNSLQVELTYDGQRFSFIALDYDNLYDLFADLSNGEISIDRLSDISIIVKGYSLKNAKPFSVFIALVFTLTGSAVGLFGLVMTFFVTIEVLIGKTLEFSVIGTVFAYIALVLIAISVVKFGFLQGRYNRNLFSVVIGYVIMGFCYTCTAVGLIEDYDRVKGYSADTIGALCIMMTFAFFGLTLVLLSKKKPKEKVLQLIRIPVLPSTSQADTIFNYMNEACKNGRLAYDEINSTERNAHNELDLFMKYSADKLSIELDDTLLFDELMTALSPNIAENFVESNVRKYYYFS